MLDSPPARVRLALTVCITSAALALPTAFSQQQRPTFRTGVTAVPIEVRVLDENRRPIADLKKEDFTILEDGIPQTVAHFVVQALEAEAPGRPLRAHSDALRFDPTPQAYRIFLLVLGNQALGNPQRHPEDLNALLKFVRERLLPQDQIALLAYNRATDFTADHEKIAEILEGFRRSEAGGRGRLGRGGGPAPIDLPSVFTPPKPLEAPGALTNTDLGLGEYVRANSKALGELDSLFYGIRYLRYMEGEKHLVFVTLRGPADPNNTDRDGPDVATWDRMTRLVRAANDARVALDTIQMGARVIDIPGLGDDLPSRPVSDVDVGGSPKPGTPEAPALGEPLGSGPEMSPGARVSARPSPLSKVARPGERGDPDIEPDVSVWIFASSHPYSRLDSYYDLRAIAGLTGGQSSLLGNTDVALGRIDTSTRLTYLLAYYPINTQWNGRYRKVKVRVNRPGATVICRHGYSATERVEAFDRRRMLADSRIDSANYSLTEMREIGVKLTPAFTPAPKGRGGEVTAALLIDATRLGWTIGDDGRHEAQLEVSIYCSDADGKILGGGRRQVSLAVTENTYKRLLKEGFTRTVKVPVTGRARLVKVAVYDYESMLVGSALAKVK